MDKKQRILLTMLELVVKQGFHATPMSQVAREANVAVGTIYHYFETKEQIIEELYMMIFKDFGVVLMANINEDQPYEEQFKRMWLNLYNYFVSNPLAFHFSEFIAVPPLIPKETIARTVPYYINIRDFFLKGIKIGKLRDVPVRLTMQMIYGNVIAAIRLKDKEELPMNHDQIEHAITMSWNTIKA
ncbi:TetR/AcrR family transcriptional regulator [Lacinutrix salivirga]